MCQTYITKKVQKIFLDSYFESKSCTQFMVRFTITPGKLYRLTSLLMGVNHPKKSV